MPPVSTYLRERRLFLCSFVSQKMIVLNLLTENLPIQEIIPDTKRILAEQNTLIVNAPPGAGKSTLLPLTLLQEDFLEGRKILMLEPRRLAARSIAFRMAELLGEKPGETVGYRIRFENVVGPKTRLEVLTEGILTRMLQNDNTLENVGMVIFDEFHERNIHADIAMALCREVQEVLRPDLRILVMSATLDMPQLTALLGAPSLVSKGRSFPVDVHYTGDYDFRMIPEMVAQTILQASSKHDGDILAFLPGQGEIKRTEEILKAKLKTFSIHPLYGQLSPIAQHQAITPNKNGKRKIVLATSIAETSLTIEGIKVVVDSGFGRTSKFSPKSGLSKLETVRISKDSADQRAGRAGRLGPGICYRMWSKSTHAAMDDFRTPEILEADLAPLALEMAEWGVKDIAKLAWLTPPPAGALAQAFDLLEQINALENGKLTPHGKSIHQIPSHPRIAHMLVMAKEQGNLGLATDMAAILEEKDPLPQENNVDINIRIEALRRARKEQLSIKALNKIEKIAQQYRKIFKLEPENGIFDPFESGLLLAFAFPERIASARPGNNAQFQLANGKLAMISYKDDLAHESWLAVAHLDARDQMGKIFLAAPLNPQDLRPLVKQKKVLKWDSKKGGLQANEVWAIGSIVLRSLPLENVSEEDKAQAILQVIASEGEQLLDFNEDVLQLLYRVQSLRKWDTPIEWPDWSIGSLTAQASHWLKPYLNGIKRNEELKKLPLQEILVHSLSYDQQQALEELAPSKIKVPSGSMVRIQYSADGETPILAVRLQEVFGWTETPRINQRKNPLLMHLLSPGFKPVQVTSDLKSFWENTYFEVKKELKRRYPKHSWPENPLEATAVAGVRRKG